MRDHGAGEFSRCQHAGFDVHMPIAQARNHVAAFCLNDLGAFAFAMRGIRPDKSDTALANGDIVVRQCFAGVDVDPNAACDDQISGRAPGGCVDQISGDIGPGGEKFLRHVPSDQLSRRAARGAVVFLQTVMFFAYPGAMDIVMFHNPDCGTSRNVRQIILDAGYRPTVIEYLQTGWTRPQLLALFAAAGVTPRQALRTTRSPAEELGLLDTAVPDETLLDHMLVHPVLVNRPIVACAQGVRLCRPSETVLELLPEWPPGPYYKEDGEMLIDGDGNRVFPSS